MIALNCLAADDVVALRQLASTGNAAAVLYLKAWRIQSADRDLTPAESAEVHSSLRSAQAAAGWTAVATLLGGETSAPAGRRGQSAAAARASLARVTGHLGSPRTITAAEARRQLRELDRQVTPAVAAARDGARMSAAVHEAGHVIANMARHVRVKFASVLDDASGYCATVVGPRGHDPVGLLGGPLACEMAGVTGVTAMLSGQDARLLLEALAARGETGLAAIAEYRRQTRAILNARWGAVVAVSRALYDRGTLTGDQITDVAQAGMDSGRGFVFRAA